jgi:prefoldin subunit 5
MARTVEVPAPQEFSLAALARTVQQLNRQIAALEQRVAALERRAASA